MKPERGPPIVLCTVDETTSEYGTGDGCSPAATRPAKCAMSTQSLAPTSSAISRNAAKSRCRGYADQPPMMTAGRCLSAASRTASGVIRNDSGSTPYAATSYSRPEKLIFMPWVR